MSPRNESCLSFSFLLVYLTYRGAHVHSYTHTHTQLLFMQHDHKIFPNLSVELYNIVTSFLMAAEFSLSWIYHNFSSCPPLDIQVAFSLVFLIMLPGISSQQNPEIIFNCFLILLVCKKICNLKGFGTHTEKVSVLKYVPA